jgi:hypothetical protein
MNRKLTVACVAWFAATIVACLDVSPTPPTPAFEAMLAAANGDGGEDAGLGADGGDPSSEAGPSDSSVE